MLIRMKIQKYILNLRLVQIFTQAITLLTSIIPAVSIGATVAVQSITITNTQIIIRPSTGDANVSVTEHYAGTASTGVLTKYPLDYPITISDVMMSLDGATVEYSTRLLSSPGGSASPTFPAGLSIPVKIILANSGGSTPYDKRWGETEQSVIIGTNRSRNIEIPKRIGNIFDAKDIIYQHSSILLAECDKSGCLSNVPDDVPAGRYRIEIQGSYSSLWSDISAAGYSLISTPSRLMFKWGAIIELTVNNDFNIAVTPTDLQCGVMRIGTKHPLKCPTVLVTNNGIPLDSRKYDTSIQTMGGALNLMVDNGINIISLDEGLFFTPNVVQRDGTLHLIVQPPIYSEDLPITPGEYDKLITINVSPK